MVYYSWRPYLSADIELVPVELAGRGRRINEQLYKDVDELIEDVFQIIKYEINCSSYAFFGHSLGSMIAYELAQKISYCNINQPSHLFFSGRGAPHIEKGKKYCLMDDNLFKKEVLGLGGTPPEFFDHPELLEVFLPLLKNDFELSESKIVHKGTRPLDVNISAFFGEEEDLTKEQCGEWKKYTKQSCSLHYFEGGHFFIHKEIEGITRVINYKLTGGIHCNGAPAD